MNIVFSEVRSVDPDTFNTFPGGGLYLYGPATLVWIVSVDADADQSLRATVFETSDLAPSTAMEDETVAAADSNQTGFQSTPVPLPNDQWGTLLGMRLVGGTVAHDVTVVAIEL